MTRRDLLRLAAAGPLAAAAARVDAFYAPQGLGRQALEHSEWKVFGPDGARLEGLRVERSWRRDYCQSRLTNSSAASVRVGNIVLFDVQHQLAAGTRVYGEGFQMLTQNGGTLEAPADLGNYTDPKHYRLPQPDGARVVYGLATFTSSPSLHHLLAFASCRRFNGAIHVRPASVQVVIEAEGLTLEPGQSWELEEFTYSSGRDRAALLDALGDTASPPTIHR